MINRFNSKRTPVSLLSLRAKRGNLPEGKTYFRTLTKYFYRGGFLRCVRTIVLTPVEMTLSTKRTARNGFATFNQNDIINQTNTLSFGGDSREIPCNRNENNRTRTIQILARRGSLPAGRGRPALPTASPRIGYIILFNRLSTMSFRALVEKSPAIETKTTVHD